MKIKEGLKELTDRIKAEPAEVPVQKVEPVNKPRTKGNEVQLNVHIDKDLLYKLKLQALKEGKSIKQVLSSAIQEYLSD